MIVKVDVATVVVNVVAIKLVRDCVSRDVVTVVISVVMVEVLAEIVSVSRDVSGLTFGLSRSAFGTFACVKRFALIGLVVFAVLACAACGGGSKQAAGSRALPPSLVKQIQAAVRNPSPIGGASSVKTVEVYGPASHSALERASLGPTGETQHVAGAWYLIVLRGHFTCGVPRCR